MDADTEGEGHAEGVFRAIGFNVAAVIEEVLQAGL